MFIDTILYSVGYIIVLTIIALVLKKDWVRLEIVLKIVSGFLVEIVYELGKSAVIAGLIGVYLIPESKDFALALKYGMILYVAGYILKK